MPKVFISYSHDSPEHKRWVLEVSDHLRNEGLECYLDQYVNGFPPEGWPLWMEKQIEQSDYVLVVCSPLYLKRFRREDTEAGRGVTFEGLIITQTLYDVHCHNIKFIPVIPADYSIDQVPLILKSFTPYHLPADYSQLYRLLTGQPSAVPIDVGSIKIMPPENNVSSDNVLDHPNPPLPTANISFFPPIPSSTHPEPHPHGTKPSLNLQSSSSNILNSIKYHISTAEEHNNVRQIEQNLCCQSLKEKRAVWIVSEWGMAASAFLWVVQNKLGESSANIYRIDINKFSTREVFLNEIQYQIGCSFEQLCEFLSVQNPAYLIFDDIPVGERAITENYIFEHDLEDMVLTVLQYCPNLRVLLRSRRIPIKTIFPVVELKSFDEPDTRAYILAHKLGGKPLDEVDVINQLYRHTDGVPSRIDSALKDLEIISLSDLSGINTDISGSTNSGVAVPNALFRAVHEISDSSDPVLKRSFELLKTLTIFPQGERLERIRRFHGAEGFHPANARELIDRALVDAVASTGIGASINVSNAVKILVVKRPVREYVYSFLDQREISYLNQKAISLYFGDKWGSGEFKQPADYKFDRPQITPFELSNAGIVIQRLLHEAIASDVDSQIEKALRVAIFYCTSLKKGSHYRSVITFLTDFLPHIPKSRFTRFHNLLQHQFASCLRMVKDTNRAKAILLDIKDYGFEADTKLSMLLDLALCHQILGEKEEAIKVSREIKRLDPKSNAALQAESIIIELSTDDPHRNSKRLKHESMARKRGSVIVANNSMLIRIEEMNNDEEKCEAIFQVITTSKSVNDLYNMTRAIVKLGKLAANSTVSLTLGDQSLLIDAYHYLYNQRISNLFNECHNALWSMFERRNDISNLLKLFRHSSLIWRLRGQEAREMEFARVLIRYLEASNLIEDRTIEKEKVYFSFRSGLLRNDSSPIVD